MRVAITGGTGVLGQGIASALTSAGHAVFASAARAGEQSAPGVAVSVVDLRDLAAVQGWLAEIGPIDALVCAAGGFSMQPLADFTEADYAFLMDINVRTAANALRVFLPALPAGGSVVLIGAQSWPGAAGVGLYAASKAAVVSLGRTAALEGRARGVRVNTLLPDIIDTPANRRAMPDADFGRWQTPAEVAAVVSFLCSPAAAVVSGNAIALGR